MGQAKNLTPHDLLRAMGRFGLTQIELAEELGVRQSSVSRWLSGKTGVPGYVETWVNLKESEHERQEAERRRETYEAMGDE